MQQQCQLAGYCHHGSTFAVLATSRGQLQPPSSQATVGRQPTQDVVGRLYQKPAQVIVAALGNP